MLAVVFLTTVFLESGRINLPPDHLGKTEAVRVPSPGLSPGPRALVLSSEGVGRELPSVFSKWITSLSISKKLYLRIRWKQVEIPLTLELPASFKPCIESLGVFHSVTDLAA